MSRPPREHAPRGRARCAPLRRRRLPLAARAVRRARRGRRTGGLRRRSSRRRAEASRRASRRPRRRRARSPCAIGSGSRSAKRTEQAAFCSQAAPSSRSIRRATKPPPLHARTLGIYPVDGPGEVAAYVRAQRLPLEALALPPSTAAPHDEGASVALAQACGAARIARSGGCKRRRSAANTAGAGGFCRSCVGCIATSEHVRTDRHGDPRAALARTRDGDAPERGARRDLRFRRMAGLLGERGGRARHRRRRQPLHRSHVGVRRRGGGSRRIRRSRARSRAKRRR